MVKEYRLGAILCLSPKFRFDFCHYVLSGEWLKEVLEVKLGEEIRVDRRFFFKKKTKHIFIILYILYKAFYVLSDIMRDYKVSSFLTPKLPIKLVALASQHFSSLVLPHLLIL